MLDERRLNHLNDILIFTRISRRKIFLTHFELLHAPIRKIEIDKWQCAAGFILQHNYSASTAVSWNKPRRNYLPAHTNRLPQMCAKLDKRHQLPRIKITA